MIIYTIGFTKKKAEHFFSLLRKSEVKTLFDIRLNNVSQLAGFAKGEDLAYFLHEICNIKYIHEVEFAPSSDILKEYRNKKLTWFEYEELYNTLLESRNVIDIVKSKYLDVLDRACFLCSEDLPDRCHRRLFVEFLESRCLELDLKVIHLV